MNKLIEELELHASISLQSMKFYQTKFMLIDSIIKDSSYKFSDTSKAILLVLCKDLTEWFTRLFEVSFKVCSEQEEREEKEKLIKEFCEVLNGFTFKVGDYYAEADTDILVMCEKIMCVHSNSLKQIVTKELEYPVLFAFADLNNFLVRFIGHAKKIVHEIDYINTFYNTEEFDPFISVDIVDITLFQDLRISSPLLRLETYTESKRLEIGDLCVKSYIDASELDSNRQLSDSFEQVLESIKSKGFNILCII